MNIILHAIQNLGVVTISNLSECLKDCHEFL